MKLTVEIELNEEVNGAGQNILEDAIMDLLLKYYDVEEVKII